MTWKGSRWWDLLTTELLAGASSLGIYLDQAHLTLIKARKSLPGLQVQHLLRLPSGAGRIADLAGPLQEAVSTWELEACPVSLAVSQELGFLQEATLPRAAAENLGQVVAYEMDRFLPVPGDHLYFDYQVLAETDTEIRLLLMALPRELVEGCLNLLDQAGLRPESLELAPAAMANAFAMLGGRLPASWLLLNLAPDSLELAHIQGRTMPFFRRVPVAPEENLPETLLREVRGLKESAPRCKALCLNGAGASATELADLSQELGLTLVTPDLFNLKGLPPETDLASLLPALGAACRGLGKVPLGANLLPPEARPGVNFGGFPVVKMLLGIFLGLFIIWGGSALVHRRVLLYQVNGQLEMVAPEARQLEHQLAEGRALAQQLDNFRRMEQIPNKLRILKNLTVLIPENTWLFHLRLSQQTLEISGMSQSASDLIPLLEKSGWLTKTEFVSPIVTDANKLEHFKIKAEVKGLELTS